MILPGQTIKELIKQNILIEDGNLDKANSSSYDLTTSDHILVFKKQDDVIELSNAKAIDTMYEKIDVNNGYNLKPGECIIMPIDDIFNIPEEYCASIRGRTSYNRLGIFTTIQHLNPGFRGKLNISIVNHSINTYKITPKMQIAQVVFERMDKPVNKELLYGDNSSYQNEDGTAGSKIYNDYK